MFKLASVVFEITAKTAKTVTITISGTIPPKQVVKFSDQIDLVMLIIFANCLFQTPKQVDRFSKIFRKEPKL